MILKTKTVFLLLLIAAVFTACKKEDDSIPQSEIDEQIILDYLAENDLEATKHESGLYYKIIKEGAGLQPSAFSQVEVYYKGYLINGSVFDETTQGSVIFPLGNMIEGWKIAIPMLKPGGRGLFLIPSALGYGSQGLYGIPANSVLVFEIDLVDVLS
jgi:FKBP-type peptidyl-prolyl cis-trans isomerase FkpA